jgi:dTDP-glucose 4,6-dehydratase
MRKRIPKILITGGAGFIGSAFARLVIARHFAVGGGNLKKIDCFVPPKAGLAMTQPGKGGTPKIVIIDKLTYAGEVEGRFKFYKTDICHKNQIDLIFAKEKPEIVVHFAAESHVDRSINDATPFIETNIKGTQILLDASRKFKVGRFIFISTDEVYGEIASGKFNESSLIKPNSPYAASKAGADLLAQAYIKTYKFPAIIIRPSNNYGPWQYPEKLIPLAILRILEGANIPVYGKGLNVREWLYVNDCALGILAIMHKGKIGQVYNLGSACESKNIDTVKLLLKTLGASQERFEFVEDRLGHDIRYSLNSNKVIRELGWKPSVNLAQGLKFTVAWSLKHQAWLKSKLKHINKLYK